ncbi:MAG: hypothetical protein GY819_10645 [Planctomycetaceae bacterium]|nr:hypothetical protein [Planctomycetaceae bacterium]MCP4463242.1 hypothetical protein [Planctomycetaceae bacterium]MDG1806770.1 hypothetical protein [Pirellulaceae bacterium]MDG2103809.1 hypothetical protein [Pirellulaceae bacterium]
MRFFQYVTVSMLPIVLVCGCNIRSNLEAPGDVYRQRFDAVVHDPFPSDQLGPTIEGARPLEYDRPMDQTTNLQTNPFMQRNNGMR